MTDAEAVAMTKTEVACTSKYVTGEQTSDGLKITAHVDAASSQVITGMDRPYFVRVDGSTAVFKSPGVIVPMTGAISVVEFDMDKADY